MRLQEMTWGWNVKGDNLGTPAESAVKASWPDYNADFLRAQLAVGNRRYNPGTLTDVEKHVFLTEQVAGHKEDAEACLKAEFEQWLQGMHEENTKAERGGGFYTNEDGSGGPKRRHVYDGVVSTQMADDKGNGPNGHTGWQATRWGTQQLTNLTGVRDFLRAGKIQKDNAERDMNILAEKGPQDLNEAWMYFKHWVKKRPVETCDEYGPPTTDRMNGTGPSNWSSRNDSDRNASWARHYGLPPPEMKRPPPEMKPNSSYESPMTYFTNMRDDPPTQTETPNERIPPNYIQEVPHTDIDFDPPTATDMAAEQEMADMEMPPGPEMRAAATHNSQFGYTVTRANSALELAQQHINAANRIQKTVTDLEMASATPLPGTVTRPQTPITQGVYPNRGFEIRQAAAEAAGSVTRDIQPNPFSMDSGGPSFGRTNMTDVWDDLNDVDEF